MSRMAELAEMEELLASDLYRRDGDRPAPPFAQRFRSPGNLTVEWALTKMWDATGDVLQTDHLRIIARVRAHDGRELARSDDADYSWLEEVLP